MCILTGNHLVFNTLNEVDELFSPSTGQTDVATEAQMNVHMLDTPDQCSCVVYGPVTLEVRASYELVTS